MCANAIYLAVHKRTKKAFDLGAICIDFGRQFLVKPGSDECERCQRSSR